LGEDEQEIKGKSKGKDKRTQMEKKMRRQKDKME
jgi:hypothetical protein